MSKIRVDEIVNKTDDGSPSFPQGATSIEPTMDNQVATKSYVDGIMASDFGSNVSISAPSNPVIGSFWTDTSSDPNILKIWDGSNWIEFSGTVDDISSKVVIETPNVLTPTDNEQDVYPVGVSLTSSTPESFIVGREQTSSSVVSSWGNAEWQLAEDSGFTTNLQTLTSPLTSTGTQSGPNEFSFGFDTDYYVRTKYFSSFPSNVFSDWSSTNTFKTSVFVDYYWLSISGGSGVDYSSDIAINSTNAQLPTIYVAGYSSSDTNNDYDALITKYNSLGTLLWKRKLRDGSYNNHDYARGVATDSLDNAYICGDTTRYTAGNVNLNATNVSPASENRIEAFVAKYDSSGNIQWQRGLGGYGKQYFTKVAVDSSGNLYAVGHASGDLLIAKYDSSGNNLWYRTYDDTEITNANGSYGNGIHIDSSGNIYVVGNAYVVSNVDENGNSVRSEALGIYLWKFDSTGSLIWQRRMRAPYKHNYGNGVTVDDSGNVYIAGSVYVSGRSSLSDSYSMDSLVAKYDSSGTLQWYRTAKTTGSGLARGKSVAIDSAGNIYLYASFHNGSSPRYLKDQVLIKYNSSGTLQFTRRFGGDQHDDSGAMAMDALENVYMCGHGGSFLPHGGSNDLMIIKVPNDGSQTGSWYNNEISYEDASSLISDSTSEAPITEEPGSYTETSLSLTDYDFGYVSSEIGVYSDTTILNP